MINRSIFIELKKKCTYVHVFVEFLADIYRSRQTDKKVYLHNIIALLLER